VEFYTVSCQREGRVFLDGCDQGDNKCGGIPRVFECEAGLHDVSLQCLIGRKCRIMTQRVIISGTNGIVPLQIRFVCSNPDS
jgi:hypothetical protein